MKQKRLINPIAALVGIALAAAPVVHGQISYLPITGDTDCEIDSGKVYTHAVDFGTGNPRALINGVQFQAGGTTFGAITGTSATVGTGTTTIPTAHAGDGGADPYLNGGSSCKMEDLVKDMNYNDSTAEITLTGLTPGQPYRFRLYNRVWGTAAAIRTQNIGFDTDGVGTSIADAESTGTFNEDNATNPDPSFANWWQVNACTYDYTLSAGVTQLKVYINATGSGTYHLYGLTNEVAGPDETPPVITSTDPDHDATGVSYVRDVLVAKFNEGIALTGSGTVTLTDLTDGSGTRTYTLPDTRVTVSGAQLTIDLSPDPDLEFITEYEVTINGSALRDTAATPNAYGGTASGEWTFTTAAEDLTPPAAPVITDDSVNGETFLTVEPTITYTLTFAETITTSATPGDFEVTGTASATVDSVTQTAPDAVEVVVTASSTGTMTLRAKALASFDDIFGNTLNGPFTDDGPVTVRDIADIEGQLGILDLSVKGGVNPATGNLWKVGDKYRFVFTSSVTTQATSTDIATYNTLVQGLADASSLGIGAAQGVTWKLLGSTAAVYARDNTATNIAVNGTGEPIYLLDGTTKVFNNYVDMWSTHAAGVVINKTEKLGAPFNTDYGSVWSGIHRNAYPDANYGTASANDQLGAVDGTAKGGLFSGGTGTQWIWRFTFATTYELPVFALSMPLTVVSTAAGSPYDTWAGGPFPSGDPLTDPDPALDFDHGGLPTGIEWVVGGDPTDGSDDASVAPTFDNTDADFFIFTYNRTDEGNADTNTTIAVEYGSDLSGWTTAVDDATDIFITPTDNGATDSVEVKIRRTLAVGDKLFARLKVVVTP